ncbi:hypothetical protein HPB47_001634 [Ixodes persulcatus]|uniref:Uncharacterized protein n=1 Tax=Ixodes persulcatus TaxID=34615 RepID=A0AC60PNT4_IXOPE|nr:hypothetical protein HPB47_001634 [Ixodes persulcatus]
MEAGADFVQSGSCPRNKQKQWSKITDGPRTLQRVRYELHQYIYTTSLAASAGGSNRTGWLLWQLSNGFGSRVAMWEAIAPTCCRDGLIGRHIRGPPPAAILENLHRGLEFLQGEERQLNRLSSWLCPPRMLALQLGQLQAQLLLALFEGCILLGQLTELLALLQQQLGHL